MLREASLDLAGGILRIWLKGDDGAEASRQADLRHLDHSALLQLAIGWEFGHAAQALEEAEAAAQPGKEGKPRDVA